MTRAETSSSFKGEAGMGQATPSVAVLAFANRSASADDEYFSDGLADELLNVLTKIKGLRVAARTSAFSFKGKQATVAQIGSALNVSCVLEGSVRKSGDRVRVSVQLVNVVDGFQLWGETYDRKLDDIFAVQDDIAQSVVNELRHALMGESPAPPEKLAAEIALATRARSDNPEAVRLCMQARFLAEQRTVAELQAAIAWYEQAIALDPTYSAAYAGLARTLEFLASYGAFDGKEITDLWGRVQAAAEAAIAHDPQNADAYLILARCAGIVEHDMAKTDRLVAHAYALNPNSVEVLRAQAHQHKVRRRYDDERAVLKKALALDPLALMARVNLASVALSQRRDDEALHMLLEIKQMSPGWWMPEAHLSQLEQVRGNQQAAIEHIIAMHRLRGNVRAADSTRAAFAAGGWEGYMRAAIANPEALSARRVELAYYHMVLGETDSAFVRLHEMISTYDERIWMIAADPRFEPLYADPRYAELLERTGFMR